jgi:hypothetical protein
MLQRAHHRHDMYKAYLSAASQRSSVLQVTDGGPFFWEGLPQLLLGTMPQYAMHWEAIYRGVLRNTVVISLA